MFQGVDRSKHEHKLREGETRAQQDELSVGSLRSDEVDGFNDTLMMRMIILQILIIKGDK